MQGFFVVCYGVLEHKIWPYASIVLQGAEVFFRALQKSARKNGLFWLYGTPPIMESRMTTQSAIVANIRNCLPWRVQVRSQPSLDRQFRFGNKLDVQAYWQSMLESGLSVSIVRDYAMAAQTTLRELMERYRDEVAPSHKGADIERLRLNRIMRQEAFVDKTLVALCTEDLQDFIMDRLTKVKPSTVDRDRDQLSHVINYADKVWKIAAVESPFKGLQRPTYFNERSRRLPQAEEKKLLEAAREDENPYVEPVIVLSLETAMRRGELLALTIDDIDFERRQALVRESKNGRNRHVPLTKRAMQVLRAPASEANERLLNLLANALKQAFLIG